MTQLDFTEKVVSILLLLTFLTDIVSTIYFFSAGYGHREANVLVVLMGPLAGFALAIVLNLLFITFLIYFLCKVRRSPSARLFTLMVIIMFVFIRAGASILNIVTTKKYLVEGVDPASLTAVTTANVAQVWVPILSILLIFYAFFSLTCWLFFKNYVAGYTMCTQKKETKNHNDR